MLSLKIKKPSISNSYSLVTWYLSPVFCFLQLLHPMNATFSDDSHLLAMNCWSLETKYSTRYLVTAQKMHRVLLGRNSDCISDSKIRAGECTPQPLGERYNNLLYICVCMHTYNNPWSSQHMIKVLIKTPLFPISLPLHDPLECPTPQILDCLAISKESFLHSPIGIEEHSRVLKQDYRSCWTAEILPSQFQKNSYQVAPKAGMPLLGI